MSDRLGRELTKEEEAAKEALEDALRASGTRRELDRAVQSVHSRNPEAFCGAVLSVLGSQPAPVRRRLYECVAERREFWMELLRGGRFNRAELLDVCREFMAMENLLDVRLAHLTPGRQPDGSGMDPNTVLRILDVLDELSPGNRLILLLNHLTRHPDPRIAAKATLLVGRRIRNPDWVAHHLDSEDGRVRASTVEGLWGSRSPAARSSLWASLSDKNNRVVGNALMGLHQLGEPGLNEFVKRMIQDARPPFRWTAAWVMGQIGAEEFVEHLEQAVKDREPHVQRAAERALQAILRRGSAAAGPATEVEAADATNQPDSGGAGR